MEKPSELSRHNQIGDVLFRNEEGFGDHGENSFRGVVKTWLVVVVVEQ